MIECLTAIKINWMMIALVIGVLLMLWVMWRVERATNGVNFSDVIIGPDGKASWSKMAAIGGFFIGSWIMVYLTMSGKLTEFFFLIYYAICIGSPVAFAIIGRRGPPDPPQQTVTATGPATSTVTIQPGVQP